jgi:hypothetical protein
MKTEEKRLAEQQRRRETLGTWEHYNDRQEEVDRHAREADIGGTTSETWPLPSLPLGNFTLFYFQNLTICCNSYSKVLMSPFVIFFLL